MLKILLIEDEPDIRENTAELLEVSGFNVYAASCGGDGIKLAKRVAPDIILCDIMMPGTDGYGVKEKLTEDKNTAAIPFIFLTAKGDLKDIRRGMAMGADDYIVKPFTTDELIRAIHTRLERFRELKDGNFHSVSKSEPDQRSNLKERVLVNINGKPRLIVIKDLILIEGEGDYTRLHFPDKKELVVRKLISEWDTHLPDEQFIRVHKSSIVNIDFIEKIEKWYNRSYVIFLKHVEKPVTVSQRKIPLLKSRFSF